MSTTTKKFNKLQSDLSILISQVWGKYYLNNNSTFFKQIPIPGFEYLPIQSTNTDIYLYPTQKQLNELEDRFYFLC